jgi:hypothetical protein
VGELVSVVAVESGENRARFATPPLLTPWAVVGSTAGTTDARGPRARRGTAPNRRNYSRGSRAVVRGALEARSTAVAPRAGAVIGLEFPSPVTRFGSYRFKNCRAARFELGFVNGPWGAGGGVTYPGLLLLVVFATASHGDGSVGDGAVSRRGVQTVESQVPASQDILSRFKQIVCQLRLTAAHIIE